jgi:hypothetical protein
VSPEAIWWTFVAAVLIFVIAEFFYRIALSQSIHPIVPEPWDTSTLSATEMYEAITDEE